MYWGGSEKEGVGGERERGGRRNSRTRAHVRSSISASDYAKCESVIKITICAHE